MREDKTFTSSDIIRIWCNNLDSSEQWWTLIFFIFIVPGIILTDRQLDGIFELLARSTPFSNVKLMIRIVSRIKWFLRKILNRTWAVMIFDGELEDAVLKCIDKQLSKIEP